MRLTRHEDFTGVALSIGRGFSPFISLVARSTVILPISYRHLLDGGGHVAGLVMASRAISSALKPITKMSVRAALAGG